MAEENKNVAPAEAGVKAESAPAGKPQGGEKSAVAARGNGNRRFGNNGRRFSRNGRGGRREDDEFTDKVIKINRVAKVIKGGKRVRFTALVVIGDGKGTFGYGLGKSNEVPDAIKKAMNVARRNKMKIVIADGDTITHPIMGEFGATKVFLKPAPKGTGLVAGGAVRAILELAGVKNVYSKIYGSRTQGNVVKAVADGLAKLKTKAQVEEIRFGKKPEVKAVKPAEKTSEAK
jgi:small subunit ribosomal protein S5